jgi:hypothetical protein
VVVAIPTKRKFRSDLNRAKSCEMSERLLKTLQNSGDFQSEYSSRRYVHSSNARHQRMSVSVVAPPRNQAIKGSRNLNRLLGFCFGVGIDRNDINNQTC